MPIRCAQCLGGAPLGMTVGIYRCHSTLAVPVTLHRLFIPVSTCPSGSGAQNDNQKSCKLQGNAGSFLGTGVALSASVAKGSPHTWQRYCAVKLHTFRVPLDVLFTKAPQWSKLVTVFCSVRKAKFVPTVCSELPAGVTKTE